MNDDKQIENDEGRESTYMGVAALFAGCIFLYAITGKGFSWWVYLLAWTSIVYGIGDLLVGIKSRRNAS
jgi:hypothetical protein